ncbi:hypothetical protein [Nostoc sp. ChiQUE01b]|uniref:hypothetical protein n=1 Tax=Nostoc sp. ChiQUE01b TaxID=3075376 RepID=UPI002AD32469|nr:hypothetical protein [Nostoc sp. ChiQUE01b]MDZ8263151.1 hypothetical protein [Nostoc sp. ChiQUE01b]
MDSSSLNYATPYRRTATFLEVTPAYLKKFESSKEAIAKMPDTAACHPTVQW